jgi:polyhydroxyalkanoate synthesis regulator phasin
MFSELNTFTIFMILNIVNDCIFMFIPTEQYRTAMSNISINQASKLFKVSRNTIYARIKKGEITKNSDGTVSVQDMMRLFGNKTDKKATEKAVTELLNSTNDIEQSIEQSKSNNEQLLQQKIEQLETQVEQLEKQLEYVKQNEAWLKQQLDQKLIEYKKNEKKGLLNRLFG